jgi:hypothetical protein
MTASADFQAHLAAEHAARDVVAVEGRFWVDIFFVRNDNETFLGQGARLGSPNYKSALVQPCTISE